MLNRIKVGHKIQELSYLCEESLHTKFYTPSTFPVCGRLVGVLKVDFSVKL